MVIEQNSKQYLQKLFTILLLAILYIVTARFGQLLAIPPGNVTPIWIPSAIILVFVLIKGYWVWPGIFIVAWTGCALDSDQRIRSRPNKLFLST